MATESETELTTGVEPGSTWSDILGAVDVLAIGGAVLLFIIGEYLAAGVLLLISIRIVLGERL